MTLVVKNLQNIVKLKMCQIEKDINILRRLMAIEKFDVSVLFVSDDYIQRLNQSYRHVEGATDVLAFPALEIAEPGILSAFDEEMSNCDQSSLGDIFLAPAFIQHQCHHHDDDFSQVMMTTITHGLCHLVGHDHETEAQQRRMVEAESSILAKFNRLTGYRCSPLTVVGH